MGWKEWLGLKRVVTTNPNYQLPNGMQIWSLNNMETRVLYKEMFEEKAYWKHGIAVSDGDVILDVGANIGMFSMYLAQHYKNLKIYAFEPITTLFAILSRNCERYVFKGEPQTDMKSSLHGSASGRACRIGLSNAPGKARFSFDPHISFASSSCPDELTKHAFSGGHSFFDWMKALTADARLSNSWPSWVTGPVLKLLDHNLARYLVAVPLSVFWLAFVFRSWASQELVDCELRTVSQMIDEERIHRIDLLKVDVEGAELAVVQGIRPEHFALIRQMVVEVHDMNGRVAQLTEVFKRHGYEVHVDQESWAVHKLSQIYTLFVRRPS